MAITGIVESDRDQDFAGDSTEDRTDLKLRATPTRDADGALQIAVAVTNAGPRTADLPSLSTPLADAQITGCRSAGPFTWYLISLQCVLPTPLAVGETRTLMVTSGSPDAVDTTVSVASEGPDLADGDNTVAIHAPAATPYGLFAAKTYHLRRAIKVRVRAVRDGRARVTMAFRNGIKLAKTVTLKARTTRAVTLRATSARRRSLTRASRTRALRARITVRPVNGSQQVSTRVIVRR
jgi:hypothetical protein